VWGGESSSSTPEPVPVPTPDPVPDPTPDPVPDPTPDPVPDPTPDPVPDPTPSIEVMPIGLWEGQITSATGSIFQVTGLIAPDGETRFINDDGEQDKMVLILNEDKFWVIFLLMALMEYCL
jgi:hypothetical protein